MAEPGRAQKGLKPVVRERQIRQARLPSRGQSSAKRNAAAAPKVGKRGGFIRFASLTIPPQALVRDPEVVGCLGMVARALSTPDDAAATTIPQLVRRNQSLPASHEPLAPGSRLRRGSQT